MKLVNMETEVNNKYSDSIVHNNRMEAILKRSADRKKNEKIGVLQSNLFEVERFTDIFNKKKKSIENDLEELVSITSEDQQVLLSDRLNAISSEIQDLQKLYSNSTLFLRIYDKKIFQESLQGLQNKFQNIENQLVPKKKFGFKVKKNKNEGGDVKFEDCKIATEDGDLSLKNFVGINGKSDENITLESEEISRRDIMLKDLVNCTIWLKGVPTTVHAANISSCEFYFGPVITSVFFENVRSSVVHLACQQLRVHESVNTDFYVHVTSKSVIENCKGLRFGIYNLTYEGIDDDYEISGLNKKINNWDKVDDFNWLITTKPSPNWDKLT